MTVLRPAALIVFAIAASSAPAGKGRLATSGSSCVATRILPDGRQVRATAPRGSSASVSTGQGRGADAIASSRSSGRSVASSSSSASSSSVGRRGIARAVSSYTDEHGRTVTTTRDERGCTIVIDERNF